MTVSYATQWGGSLTSIGSGANENAWQTSFSHVSGDWQEVITSVSGRSTDNFLTSVYETDQSDENLDKAALGSRTHVLGSHVFPPGFL